LKYTKYSEIPKTEPFNFISELGGILGLFIGCSFVTLFELAEVLIEICFIIYGRKKQNQNEIPFEEEIKRLKNDLNEANAKIEFLLKAISKPNETQL
jgi:hypothetical protein